VGEGSLTEFRYINWTEYGNLADALAEKLRSQGEQYDLIIGIARGGIPVAMVVSDHLNVKLDIINVKSYSGIGEREKPRILTTLTESISGKRVLLVDDLVDQGDTVATVTAFLRTQNPALLKTAVLFRKPWTKTEPDYFLEVVDKWIVFPWEHGEVNRLRIAKGEALHEDFGRATYTRKE
jgi:hypoxanthine phosphoribosyltransferase